MFEKYKKNSNGNIRQLLFVTGKTENTFLFRMVTNIARKLELELEVCSDTVKALEIAKEAVVNTILVDMDGVGSPGRDLAKSIRACDIETPMLIFTSDAQKVQHFNIAGCFNLDPNVDESSLREKIIKSIKFDLKLREMYVEIDSESEEYDRYPEQLKQAKVKRMKVDKFQKKFEELARESVNE